MMDAVKNALPNAPSLPQMGMPVGPPALFPNGIGITDRPQHEEDSCGCKPTYCCMCCAAPIFYTDAKRQSMTQMVEWKYNCNGRGFHVDNADIFGTQLSFSGYLPCCSCTQMVDVFEQGRKIGHVEMYVKPCTCSETVMSEAFDATGVSKFQRLDNPCNPTDHFTGSRCCGWGEHNWPVVFSPSPQSGPITHITYRRYSTCTPCYPSWIGIRQMPQGAPPDDQKLLLAMVHARWWRAEQDKQRKQQGGNQGVPSVTL